MEIIPARGIPSGHLLHGSLTTLPWDHRPLGPYQSQGKFHRMMWVYCPSSLDERELIQKAFSPYPAQSYYSSDDKSGKAFQSYPHPSYHFDGGKAGKALPRPDRSTVHASWPQRDFYLEESQKWNALRRQTRPILSPSPPPCPRPRPVSSSPGFPTGYTLSAWEPEGQNHVLLGTPAIDDYAEKKPRTLRKHASGMYRPTRLETGIMH